MGVVSYLTIDGEILSETRDGVERDYLPDSLGSTIGLSDWDPWSTGLDTSQGRAFGLMQIKPGLWTKSCSDWGESNFQRDPCGNVRCGMAILCYSLGSYSGNWRAIGNYYECARKYPKQISNCLAAGGAVPG